MRECKRIGEATIMEVSDEVDMDVQTTKKRKTCDGDGKLNSVSSELEGSSASCCSTNVGSSNSKSLDLDEKGVEAADSQAKSGEMESTEIPETENFPPRLVQERHLLTDEEIEEFLAKCEKEMLIRFREKYNFDFEKEEPLEGRYEWVKTYGN